jgi:NAD(P)-dependent dehydrogenase (short-subunit alcohol dehydrogenase family)
VAASHTTSLDVTDIFKKGNRIVKSVLLIGATQGTGRALAAEYARRGANVVITGRGAERAAEVAEELSKDVPGTVTSLSLDLTRPAEIADVLAPIERVDRLAVVGMTRDRNTMAAYDVAAATELAVTKVVGYTAVVSTLASRMAPGSSVLLFGGMAKDYPYPGSTTVSAVNGAVTGLVRTMSVELAPVRVNAIHPGPIEDSPYWEGNTAVLDHNRKLSLAGRLGSMNDIVDACVFLLENSVANGIDLRVDGGRL